MHSVLILLRCNNVWARSRSVRDQRGEGEWTIKWVGGIYVSRKDKEWVIVCVCVYEIYIQYIYGWVKIIIHPHTITECKVNPLLPAQTAWTLDMIQYFKKVNWRISGVKPGSLFIYLFILIGHMYDPTVKIHRSEYLFVKLVEDTLDRTALVISMQIPWNALER